MRLRLAFLLIAGLSAPPVLAQAPAVPAQAPAVPAQAPPAGPALTQVDKRYRKHIVAAAHPLAVEAGLAVLREGGSAADAVIAVQMMLALVEPQSSGLGGGALALSFNHADREVLAWDGSETAPAAAGPDLFLDRDGKPMAMPEAGVGGRAVGVPGAVRMLEALHRAQGRLPWDRLLAPAIKLAEAGFPVSARLAAAIAADGDRLRRQPAARAYFFLPDGSPLPPGHLLVNRPLSETLRAIAAGGADALLHGAIGSDIATAVRTDPNPGLLTTDDLAAITARARPAVCGAYRAMTVCGMGPPSSGGIAVLQILGMLGHFNLQGLDPAGADATHLLIEAEKLAYADRALYLADLDFVSVPIRGLLDPAYLTARAQSIDIGRANPAPKAGNPDLRDIDVSDPVPAPALPPADRGASQIVVIDDDGNAVSMTTTLRDSFGARLMVRGFLLNDELTDFAFTPQIGGHPVANRVEGGKRPRSSMSPTLVFTREGALRIATGSQGGSRIPGFIAQALMRMIDFDMPPWQALAAPHAQTTGVIAEVESGPLATDLADQLRARGQTVTELAIDSGQQAAVVTPDGLIGGTDPRREGTVAGD